MRWSDILGHGGRVKVYSGLIGHAAGVRLTRHPVSVEPAEGQASSGAWPASAAAFPFRRPRPGWNPQGRVWPPPITKGEPAGNQPLGLEAVRDLVQVHGLVLERHRRSVKMLSRQRPLPSMEIATPASLSTEVNSRLVKPAAVFGVEVLASTPDTLRSRPWACDTERIDSHGAAGIDGSS